MIQGKKFPKATILVLGLAVAFSSGSAAFSATKYDQLSEEAENYYKNRNYAEAQKCFEQALKESDKSGINDKKVATTFYNLALCLQAQGQYAEAEKNMVKSLDMMKLIYGPDHQRTAQVYMDLADLYLEQAGQENKPELKPKAAENYKKGIEIFEKIYNQAEVDESNAGDKKLDPSGKGDKKAAGKKSPQEAAADLSTAIKMLADYYAQEESYAEADPLYKRSLELEEYASGPDDKELAKHKSQVGEYYCVQAKYKFAEPLYQEALATLEKVDPNSTDTANLCYKYGGLYYDQGMYGNAEIMFKKAMKIYEKDPDQKESDLAQKNISLGDVLDMQGKIGEAQSIYVKAIATLEKEEDKSPLIACLKQYQKHLLMQNKKEEAARIAIRIKELKGSAKKTQ